MEEFHNSVKYEQWTPYTNGCLRTTTSVVPSLLVVPFPLVELLQGVFVAPLEAIIPLMIET
jgi:hypothetical protein